MSSSPDARPELLLHALRVKGRADPGGLARAVDLDESAVAAALQVLAGRDWVSLLPGARPAWALTPDGREQHRRALAAERDANPDAVEAIEAAYQGFVALDQPVKAVCTAWQVRDLREPLEINDHLDPVYDKAVVDRLSGLHRRARVVVDDLTRAIDRFRPYGRRLDDAHGRILAGDGAAFTTPLTDSYHDVWMELHEDLLVTLVRERDEAVT